MVKHLVILDRKRFLIGLKFYDTKDYSHFYNSCIVLGDDVDKQIGFIIIFLKYQILINIWSYLMWSTKLKKKIILFIRFM